MGRHLGREVLLPHDDAVAGLGDEGAGVDQDELMHLGEEAGQGRRVGAWGGARVHHRHARLAEEREELDLAQQQLALAPVHRTLALAATAPATRGGAAGEESDRRGSHGLFTTKTHRAPWREYAHLMISYKQSIYLYGSRGDSSVSTRVSSSSCMT